MIDDEPPAATFPPAAPRGVHPGTRVWATLGRRAVELVIVFAGVYAAFLLNRLDTDRHDARRRAQIVGELEREVSENADELKGDLAGAAELIAGFDRQLAAGDMPHLGITYTNSSYSDNDAATLLQAGGLDLFDMQTLALLRRVNVQERELVAATHNHFEACLTMLANHHNEEFYDPATRQLRPQYEWYPVVLHNLLHLAQSLLAAEESLLAHLHSAQGTPAPGPR